LCRNLLTVDFGAFSYTFYILLCFDTVGYVRERASGL